MYHEHFYCIFVLSFLSYGHTPLKLAAEKGNQQTVKWLIEKEAVITKADSVGLMFFSSSKMFFLSQYFLLSVMISP